jgi:dGTPase
MKDPKCLPAQWQNRYLRAERDGDDHAPMRVIADYIASLTDRGAMSEHRDIFDIYNGI